MSKLLKATRLLGALFAASSIMAAAVSARAQETFTVKPVTVADEKVVFATVESVSMLPARARIGGTVAELTVKEGDRVESGQVVANVGDEKLVLQMKSLDAQIAGLEAQLAQAQSDLARAEGLMEKGTIPRTRLDEARTAANVAANALRARTAERAVLQQQLSEGGVLAPSSGRVIKAPVKAGAVVLPGETIAVIAARSYVLRLRVPERHARNLKVGDPVRLDAGELGDARVRFGKIELIYPQIEDGRVTADAVVEGLEDYFVGARIRVWVSGGERTAFMIPASFVATRFGIDYVAMRKPDGGVIDVPVQRGRDRPWPEKSGEIEILSGVLPGDVLVRR